MQLKSAELGHAYIHFFSVISVKYRLHTHVRQYVGKHLPHYR